MTILSEVYSVIQNSYLKSWYKEVEIQTIV